MMSKGEFLKGAHRRGRTKNRLGETISPDSKIREGKKLENLRYKVLRLEKVVLR